MDEMPPADLTPEEWAATLPRVKVLVRSLLAAQAAIETTLLATQTRQDELLTKIAALEARLNQNSQNSSKLASSEPPSAPPRPVKTPRGKPKSKGAQLGHPDQQRELVPTENVSRRRRVAPHRLPLLSATLP